MLPLRLMVLGEPKAQPRAKARACGGFVMMYTPATAKEWKAAVAKAIKPYVTKTPVEGPLEVNLTFFMPRPKAHYLKAGLRSNAPTWHIAKPDKDNLTKAVYDSISDTGFWKDDSLVCAGYERKRYADTPESVGCLIEISAI